MLGKWIGRRGGIEWPPRSPDLTPLDFFLWGVTKQTVFAMKHHTIAELKNSIVTALRSLPVELCEKVCRSVPERLQFCKSVNGGHIEHLM